MTRNTELNRRVKRTLGVTLAIGLLAVTGCGPKETGGKSLVDVAQSAARGEDRVSVRDLATWIIEGRGDFLVVDVRMPEEFNNGAIDDARNIPLAQLVGEESLAELPTDRKVVVYSNGSENAAKAAVMLRLAGINAHVLVGGYNAWHSVVLNPDISAEALDGETLQVSEQRAYACYFVGECAGETPPPAKPFTPPVFVESEPAAGGMPPPAAAEGC